LEKGAVSWGVKKGGGGGKKGKIHWPQKSVWFTKRHESGGGGGHGGNQRRRNPCDREGGRHNERKMNNINSQRDRPVLRSLGGGGGGKWGEPWGPQKEDVPLTESTRGDFIRKSKNQA